VTRARGLEQEEHGHRARREPGRTWCPASKISTRTGSLGGTTGAVVTSVPARPTAYTRTNTATGDSVAPRARASQVATGG
jgi:hypothetical protein